MSSQLGARSKVRLGVVSPRSNMSTVAHSIYGGHKTFKWTLEADLPISSGKIFFTIFLCLVKLLALRHVVIL